MKGAPMTATKPTPGPWIVSDVSNRIDGYGDVRSFAVTDSSGHVIMDAINSDVIVITAEGGSEPDDDIRHYDWQSLANARLMAAAPEMLSALQTVARLKSLPDPVRKEVERAIVFATTRRPD